MLLAHCFRPQQAEGQQKQGHQSRFPEPKAATAIRDINKAASQRGSRAIRQAIPAGQSGQVRKSVAKRAQMAHATTDLSCAPPAFSYQGTPWHSRRRRVRLCITVSLPRCAASRNSRQMHPPLRPTADLGSPPLKRCLVVSHCKTNATSPADHPSVSDGGDAKPAKDNPSTIQVARFEGQ